MPTETPSPPEPPPEAEAKHRRIETMQARAKVAQLRLDEARRHHRSIDTAFCYWEEDRRLAASVLAGGISFRLFFWLLPFALILGGALGFASSESATEAAKTLGLTAAAAASIADSVEDTGRGRWALLLIGTGALLWTSSWSVIALRRVHALIWGVPPTKSGTNPLVSALAFSGVVIALLATPAGAARLRDVSPDAGLLVQLLAIGVFFAVWLWASAQLPHGDAPLRALVPGALLAAVAAQFVHLFSVLYVAVRLDRASDLYGGLGLAATALFILYVVGRVVIGSAVLNAELWRRRTDAAAAHPGEPLQR
jgi:uncharacterized BrkB/YihY/UPF0761 family membrane protein